MVRTRRRDRQRSGIQLGVTTTLFVAALTAACGTLRADPPAPAKVSVSMTPHERVLLASTIYAFVKTYFPDLAQRPFEASYAAFVATILRAGGRRDFDLAAMELLASLQDGHTWFNDPWLDTTSGGPVGLTAYPIAGRWTVVHSRLDSVGVGDVISAVDGTRIEAFFAQHRKHISASSDRDAGIALFDTPAIFPTAFRLTLADGRIVVVDRSNAKVRSEPTAGTEGRWLTPDAVAYIKVPTFHGIANQARAIDYLQQFRGAKAIIIDVRGNPGGGYPAALKEALMDRPYRAWKQTSAAHGGELVRNSSPTYPQIAFTTTSEAIVRPRNVVYAGRVILLTDRRCTSGCEDFVMPFKTAKRATLIGEATGGTFSDTARMELATGMRLNVTAVRNALPDGSRFEGAGIAPDIEITTTAEDLKSSRDPVLLRALELAGR